jgi:hypothetical protein
MALQDYCEDNEEDINLEPEVLLAQFDDARDDVFIHAMDHRRSAKALKLAGDEGGASIHRALLINMARAAK